MKGATDRTRSLGLWDRAGAASEPAVRALEQAGNQVSNQRHLPRDPNSRERQRLHENTAGAGFHKSTILEAMGAAPAADQVV